MTVYVDSMRAPVGRMIMCHMVADSEQELHAMAVMIGVARKWYQDGHYDIALSKRAAAVSNGAVELTMMELGRWLRQKRKGNAFPRQGPSPSGSYEIAKVARQTTECNECPIGNCSDCPRKPAHKQWTQ